MYVYENDSRSVSYPVKPRYDSSFPTRDFTSQNYPSTDFTPKNYPASDFTPKKYPPSDFMLTNRRRDETNDGDNLQLEGEKIMMKGSSINEVTNNVY